ncbi:MAG: DEAD/DEAH box helicase family protein [Chloroflexota bacterium]
MRQHTTTSLETVNPRNKIIDIYLEAIRKSLDNSHPAIKLVNFGTGSGKTHQFFQAVIKAIQDNPGVQIIGLYVAPLRENLTVPPSITSKNPGTSLYILYSEEWKTSDEFLKKYNCWIPAIRANQKLWGQLKKNAGEPKAGEAGTVLAKAKVAISDYELIKRLGASDNDALKAKLLQAQRDITGSLDKFLEILIKAVPNEDAWPDECLELVKIYYPLFLLRAKSGILLMTYKKFETEIPYFVEDGGKRWIKRKSLFDEYVREYSSETCRFLMAFDEQEDGYQIMLEEQIDIISPKALAINNALSSIYREFAVLFTGRSEENRTFLRFLRKNPGALREWIEYYEKGKDIDESLQSLADIFHRLTYLDGNSPNFLTQTAAIDAGIGAAFRSINAAFGNFGEEQRIRIDFERLAKVLAAFENNRALVIPHKLYSRYAEDLMNIFSYNNLYIYNIDVLKNLAIRRNSSGHVLIYEMDENRQDEVTVAELIYSILAVRLQIEAVRKLLGVALDADDSQSRSLDIWSRQITRLQNANESSQPPASIPQYLDRVYVYERLKSIINIMEISRYQNPENNLIHAPLREVSIGSTAILTSPEHRILSILKHTHNIIFLVSATGGVYGDLSTSFDMRYLEDELREDETGQSSFEPMRDGELALSEQIRAYRRQNRTISVGFFNDDFLSFPNQQTQEVVERFERSVLSTFFDEQKTEGRWFGAYKVQEIRNFIRFLFYLFEDDSVHQIIAFTQTLTWIRKLINHAVRVNNLQFIFRAIDEHPNIFTVEVHHAKYTSSVQIRLILYESRFNTQYRSAGRTYQDELVQRDGEKIFFISAYQSASKGLNPTIQVSDGGDEEKDFDAIVLLMDKYFSVMGPGTGKSKDSEKSTTQTHFILMKNLVRLGNTTIEIKDFNQYLSDPEAKQFRDLQHQILLGKGILQSIGRTERRDYPGQTIRIFINEESRKNLVNYYRHLQRKEPDEVRKLSVNNYEVFEHVMEEERKRTIQDYDSHVFAEIDATVSFQSFRKIMLDQIDRLHEYAGTADIVKQWEMLRAPLVFQDPTAYLEMLHQSGLFPVDFVDSLFYRRGDEQPEFTPYLSSEEEDGRTHQIISDSQHSDKVFPYLSRMYPDFLKIGAKGFDANGEEIARGDLSTDQIQTIYRKFIPNPAIFAEFVPRPRFFYDVLYPSLTENIVETWIRDVIFDGKSWKAIQSAYGVRPLTDFRTYHKLFERFDLFYVRGSALYCIDVKAWSEVSGYRLSHKTVDKAIQKLEEIQAAYPKFTRVSGLLLNLHAPLEKHQELAADLSSGNLFYLDANHNPVESNTLRDFLIRRGQ